MTRFRTDSKELGAAFERKRHLPVLRSADPASHVCNSCWAKGRCLRLILKGDKPHTCCVYDFFYPRRDASVPLEDLVAYTCETACVKRQSWEHDDVPHDASYCQDHCPVSRYILGRGPSNYEP